MASSGVNPPGGPPPTRVPAGRRRPPPKPQRRNWLPAVIVVVVAAVVIAAVAGFVLLRSDDDGGSGDPFAEACSIVDSEAVGNAVGYEVGTGVAVATAPPLSGCTFAPTDAANPPIGVIVTDDARNAEPFDRDVLEASYTNLESVRGLGSDALFLTREGATPEVTDALLVVTDADKGVEVSVAGLVTANKAFDLARSVAALYVDELGLG